MKDKLVAGFEAMFGERPDKKKPRKRWHERKLVYTYEIPEKKKGPEPRFIAPPKSPIPKGGRLYLKRMTKFRNKHALKHKKLPWRQDQACRIMVDMNRDGKFRTILDVERALYKQALGSMSKSLADKE